ncbi:hypothetical protein RJ641_035263 [Dillenia turbinata]|uniref:Uncharacterized protein n=1 Tax=Dillenia turbinata TaxID=194707 RepID=A0AAN8VHE2_9MAGN
MESTSSVSSGRIGPGGRMENSSSIVSGGTFGKGSMTIAQKKQGIKIENPFTFKVGQVFTGFGIGCGIGIGVGRPLNLGAIPMLGQVMSTTRGATDVFAGVSKHLNDSLKKIGAKNVEAGVGCGVGFGHGFGVVQDTFKLRVDIDMTGLAVKPGVMRQIQSCLMQTMTKVMMKFGMAPGLNIGQGMLPASMQGGIGMMNEPSIQNPIGSIMPLTTKAMHYTSQSLPDEGNLSKDFKETSIGTSFSRSEKVLNSFLQDPNFKENDTVLDKKVGRLQSENSMLHMVLKHQQMIEKLMEENEKLRKILLDNLNIPASKLESRSSPCKDCFECRRRRRKK